MNQIDLPPYQPEPVKCLSEELKEVFGCELPDIDRFQTSRAIIGIPRQYISEIIRKGNAMKLIGIPTRDHGGLAEAFMRSFRALRQTPKETIDCFTAVFAGKNIEIEACDIKEYSECVASLPEHINALWGFYIVDDMPSDFIQVITVLTTKRDIK